MRIAVLTYEDGLKTTVASDTEEQLTSCVECMKENGVIECNHVTSVEYLEPVEVTSEPKVGLEEHNFNDDLDSYYYDC